MYWRLQRAWSVGLFQANDFASAAFGLDLGASRGAESMSANGKFPGQLTSAEDFDTGSAAIGETCAVGSCCIHAGAIIETIERLQVDWQITNGVASVIEAALGNAPDQRHLAAFEADGEGAA